MEKNRYKTYYTGTIRLQTHHYRAGSYFGELEETQLPTVQTQDVASWILEEPSNEAYTGKHAKSCISPLDVLHDHFGYASFRNEQENIINAVISKRDTLALMPTGGGKSLCYQIPALLFDGLTIVISPLIALMKDQVDALRLNGIAAAYLNSTLSHHEQEDILRQASANELKLLYLAPERLVKLIETITDFPVSLIAVDEAHCISQWGHDFRPEYLMIAQLKHVVPHVPVIALTATADKLTRKDIIEKLELNDPAVFVSSFNRPNIRYTVESKVRSTEKLLTFLDKRREDSGIIYCLSRLSTEKLADMLQREGFSALPYHAGMDRQQRDKNQELFVRDEVKIIVATIAFGMGIDKSNVRYVVHMDLPKNIESYYQETGRAGRDGLESESLLFFSRADVGKLKSFVHIDGNPEQTKIQLEKLDRMGEYGEIGTCRRKYLLNYFDEQTADYCGNCDVCLTKFEQTDGTILAQKALSAIVRLREQYGAGYIIDFLRGSHSAKIREEHRLIKTFGAGKELSKEEWKDVLHYLVNQKCLMKSEGIYPVLRLTLKGYDVLKGQERIMIPKVKERIERHTEQLPYEEELLRELKSMRRELALAENLPPHVILSDASLMEIATYLPLNREAFLRISGFSRTKLDSYGENFWHVVADYCRENSLQSRMHLKPNSTTVRKFRRDRETDTKRESFDLFKQGYSIEEIASIRDFRPATIETHLAYYVAQGQIDVRKLVSEEKIKIIREAIKTIGGDRLTPIKEFLGETYGYGEIRLVMAASWPPKGGTEWV